MKVITLKDAKPGMKLAKPVTDPGGAKLVEGGIELSSEMLDRLRHRRVDSICVEEDGAPLSDADREKALAEIDADVDRMFAEAAAQSEVMQALAGYAKQYLKSKVK